MVEYHSCAWLVVHRLERCGRRCVGRICGVHLAQLRRKPGTMPRPCRVCGRGTKSETQRCSKACGADNVRYRLLHAVAVRNRTYPGVLREFLRMAERQRTLPFIGLRN